MSHLYLDPGEKFAGKQKVMLATPSYDSPDASYTFSISKSREALHKAGVQTAYLLLQGNCHVDDSRNTIVREFLDSDCTDLIFLDADVSWETDHLVALCGFDCDIVGGVYPYRRDGGGNNMPVRNIDGVFEPDENGLLEVEGLPTGFMRIKRRVLELMIEGAPTFKKNGKTIHILFERDVWKGGRRGGDIRFCMNWRDMGGKLFAAANMRLGHCGKHIVRDSLAASLRRQVGATLPYLVKQISEGKETEDDYCEAIKGADNPWGADVDVLSISVLMARKATGPILEIGSGLTTVFMAAANPDVKVWAIEHSPFYAMKLRSMVELTGLKNVVLVTAPLKGGWYDLAEDADAIPKKFSVALVDGPPRAEGDRMQFFKSLADRCESIIADDADDPEYRGKMQEWADQSGMEMQVERRAAVLLRKAD